MGVMVFNTLKYAKHLEDAGFTRQQAEAQANIISEVMDEKMATKQDLRELEYRLTIHFGGLLALAVAALAGLMTILK